MAGISRFKVQRAWRAYDRMERLILAHFQRRQELECLTLASILAEPLRGRELVRPLGLMCHHFDDECYQLIYAAVLVAADRGKEVVLRLSYKALLAENRIDEMLCDPSQEIPRRRFSIGSLVRFACSFPGPSEAPLYARKLLDAIQRQVEVTKLWKRMGDLLSYEVHAEKSVSIAPFRFQTKRGNPCCKSFQS